MLWSRIRRYWNRRKRSQATCELCGKKGSLRQPLMFVAELKSYRHYPDCMPTTAPAPLDKPPT